MTDNKNLLYLFDRPEEPIHMPKGEDQVTFDIPAEYSPDRSPPRAKTAALFTGTQAPYVPKIAVCQITIPDLGIALGLGRRDAFSLFIPYHRKMATKLIEIFMDMSTCDDLLSVSLYCKSRVNPDMFIYALSVAILHRPDTKNLAIPPLYEFFPGKFVDSGISSRAKEEAHLVDAGSRKVIEIRRDNTASDLDVEHRVAYFREDLGINLHHWHWHLVYPYGGSRKIVNKDRRGELFYYMHQQIVARYNFERLCNRLSRVTRFSNWQDPIPEGYFPKLDSRVANRSWAARTAGTVLKDINRPEERVNFAIQDLQRWRDRIFDAIHRGTVTDSDGNEIKLTETSGIDVLGNILESSILSPNPTVYGDLHNFGHIAIAYCHDPDYRHLESSSVMGDSATAMRDPIFYRWHAFIDDIFQEHKNNIPAYTTKQLDYRGIQVTDIQVISPNQPTNVFSTFWQQSDVNISGGLGFTPRGPLLVRFTHLNHAPFTYRIAVNNHSCAVRRGTVRIFIAPKQDERGIPFTFREQKRLMVELDRFTTTLRAGNNTIERRSDESAVTIPFERTFRNPDANRPTGGKSEEKFNFCGCGWPDHVLIPKGTKAGFPADLFVMVSDFAGDRVDRPETGCSDASSYCGIKDSKYPDARSMGYPFDRRPRPGADTMQQFMTDNMRVVDVTIRFDDHVRPPNRPETETNEITLT